MEIGDEIVRRWRAAVAWLSVRTAAPPKLTAWALAADIILAVLLCIGAVDGAAEPYRDDTTGPIFISVDPRPAPDPGAFRPQDLQDEGPAGPLLIVAALTALPLAVRRRYPLGAFLVIALCAFRVNELHGDPTWTVIAVVIAAYSAPMYSRYRNLALACVVLAGLLVVKNINVAALPAGLMTFALLSSVGLAANAVHTWRLRARTLEQQQSAATRDAVARERARMARELHDVVSHNVSVMVVQAGAARTIMDTSPDQARAARLAVEAGGRAAMTELRQAIGLLTVDDTGTDLAPQPGLDQLEPLVARVRATGVPVSLELGPLDVAPGVALAAYRVVQEALTNAVRHAPGAAVEIQLHEQASVLRVEITDTGGTSPAGAHQGSGRGLIGLRERVAVYGGTLTAGPRPTGGFRVRAEIPLDGGPA